MGFEQMQEMYMLQVFYLVLLKVVLQMQYTDKVVDPVLKMYKVVDY
jgi:hypothetical protein